MDAREQLAEAVGRAARQAVNELVSIVKGLTEVRVAEDQDPAGCTRTTSRRWAQMADPYTPAEIAEHEKAHSFASPELVFGGLLDPLRVRATFDLVLELEEENARLRLPPESSHKWTYPPWTLRSRWEAAEAKLVENRNELEALLPDHCYGCEKPCRYAGADPKTGAQRCATCLLEIAKDDLEGARGALSYQDGWREKLWLRLCAALAKLKHYEETLCLPDAPPLELPEGTVKSISAQKIGDLVEELDRLRDMRDSNLRLARDVEREMVEHEKAGGLVSSPLMRIRAQARLVLERAGELDALKEWVE